jgi:hypothetical protein
MNVVSHSRQAGFTGRHEAEGPSSLVAVPAVEWRSFLERFGRRHRAWLATIHGIERGRPVTRVTSAAFESVALERHDSEQVVRLTFANGVSLCAPRPRGVRVQRTVEGAESALEIETANGAFIRMAFRATALAEQVDGVTPGELMIESRSHH